MISTSKSERRVAIHPISRYHKHGILMQTILIREVKHKTVYSNRINMYMVFFFVFFCKIRFAPIARIDRTSNKFLV